eukprot:scaffold161402_cov30-Tisochrysis_lutea.AAC.7
MSLSMCTACASAAEIRRELEGAGSASRVRMPSGGTPTLARASTVRISRVSVVSREARSLSSTRGSARPLRNAPAKRGPHTADCRWSTSAASSRGTRNLDSERAMKGKF